MNINFIWSNSTFKVLTLSPQEQRVLDHMVKGDCCKTSAHKMGITTGTVKQYRTNLFRKVKALTGLTAHELLRNYRLKRAAHLLRAGVPVSETAFQVGFESRAYFSKCFRELYQVSPSDFMM